MPKTKSDFPIKIEFRASENMCFLIKNARFSKGSRKQFGRVPSKSEFIRNALLEWVENYSPEMIKIKGEIPEMKQYNNIKYGKLQS